MNILQINAVYKKLSTGANVYEMNQSFSAQGHRCVAAFSVGKIEDPETEYIIGGYIGQKTHALFSRITGLQGYFSSHATRKLLRYMDTIAPDVVVLNNLHANYIHLPMLLKYLAKKDIPTVAVLHDCWFYTGKCCYYSTAACNKWKTECHHCPAKKFYNKSWFFDRSQKMFRDRKNLFRAIPRLGVVAVSEWLLEQAKQSPVFQNAKYITRIHNWIDTEMFAPVDGTELKNRLGLENKKIILAVAAVWEPRKGLDTLLWLGRRLQPDETLVVIGKTNRAADMPQQVVYIPTTATREELIAYYSIADVFVQPSLEETFGKVTAEAISCGTPVVCYNSTANPELVGDGCGAVVPAGEKEEMLAQIRNVLQQGKGKYSPACRQFALQRFDTKQIFSQYGKLFFQLQNIKKEERKSKVRILWVVNMVMPDAAKALGISTSFSGSWMIDPLKMLAQDDSLEIATVTYGRVEKPQIVTVNNVKHFIFPGAGKRLLFSSPVTDENCKIVLNDFKPDLIHIYGTEYAIGYSMLKLQPKIPILLTIQGILTYISREYRGGLSSCRYHTLATCKQLLSLKAPLFSELLFKLNARRERKIVKQVKYITGRTDHDKAFALAINPEAEYFRLNYNLREEFYTANKWSIDHCQRFTIFTGAATYPLKGLHMLLEAVALVKKKYPEVKLIVPGNNVCYKKSNGYERFLHRKIKALSLQDNIEFVGRRSGYEMIEHLQTANVYVLPSSYDTDSLSLCEAQMIGTPCIASMRGGTGDIVQDKISGFCYNYSDYPLLAERICQLFENEQLCQELSENAKRQATVRHSRLYNVEQQRRLYQGLLEKQ